MSKRQARRAGTAGTLALVLAGAGALSASAAGPPDVRPDKPPASHPTAKESHFGEEFPNLPGFTAPTVQQLADLAQGMLDPNARRPATT